MEIPTTSSPDEARAIAKEAYIYGFPLVDSYRISHAYFVNKNSPEYKAHYNKILNMPRVYTSEDKAVQTPNSDTPYSMLGIDLRAEPIVLTVPSIEEGRYYSVQLVDAYTFNFAYIGSRATGNGKGTFLIAGLKWKGEKPNGIDHVINCETEMALAIFRTQLFEPSDIEKVKKVQAGYEVQTLSEYLNEPSKPVSEVDFITPLSPEEQKTSPKFYNILNFVLKFCPTHPTEVELMNRFAKINIGPGLNFNSDTLSPEILEAVKSGMADGQKELEDFRKSSIDTGKVTSGDLFGTREFLKNNYLYRYAGTVIGIYGNSREEAMYPIYGTDSLGNPLDGSVNRYKLHFAADLLPPVNAFWSLTMYELPSSLLYANPINRYLINSSMLPSLKRDEDGGITLWLQNESPGSEKESNWLPAPKGPFTAVLRLYWPKEEVINRKWKQPPLEIVE
jgi:hypothetical protein